MKTTLIILMTSLFTFSLSAQDATANLDPTEIRETVTEASNTIDAKALYLAATQMAKGQLLDFVNKEVVYPEAFAGQSMEGTVTVDFWINEKGEIIQTKVMKGINAPFDNAIMEKVKTLKALHLEGLVYHGANRLRIPIDFSMY